ncbi:adenylosuccinate lyase [Caldimicrobium thiodismutans]|uniref:Adenylosuccinate lyase n=1 Tax=Caldimicrobium thiodismutans TaxID=1653476 RepID=A0A0U5BXA7_9BACT|nr:adenylosuccinate lyase [Caldimicrobium thiodismutans]BAU23333.1 adenylosuccinate lyase [Caldimicrobium thiodismutans]
MIPRYTRPVMAKLWSEEEKLRVWLLVEFYAMEAWYKLGKVPEKDYQILKEKLTPYMEKGFTEENVKRVEEIEKETRHDVIAFLTHLAEIAGPSARYLHLGMTSSDMLDTAMAYRMKRAMEIILEDLDNLLESLKQKAFQYKDTPMIGRTHGIHAEPITFGLKMALFYEEMKRNKERLLRAKENISYGKISGAVGTFAHLPPEIEAYTCEKLGLKPEPISNQIVQRDRYAEYMCALGILASSIEKMATEIRHLQRTEVLEAEEPFHAGQKGSSAMPHKRNPILTENLCGLARTIRAYVIPALENVVLWHERDISHSSSERMIIPSATALSDFALVRLNYVIKNLQVYPERMLKNLHLLRGLIFSQQVLLSLVEKGLTREEAYMIVQENAMKVWKEENLHFKEALLRDERVRNYLSPEELESLFDLKNYLSRVDTIFARVFA